MEALLTHGEGLLVPERMIISPSVGVFRPLDDLEDGTEVDAGQTVGHLDGPGSVRLASVLCSARACACRAQRAHSSVSSPGCCALHLNARAKHKGPTPRCLLAAVVLCT